MEIEKGEIDLLLLEADILKKDKRKLIFQRGPNGHLVKYAKAQITRLRSLVARGQYQPAYKLGMFLAGRSIVFNLMALSQCFPT